MGTTLSPDTVIADLRSRWGNAVITDPAELDYFATDVYAKGEALLAVLRPTNTAQLAAAVAGLTAAGVAVIARGGGMSYTGG